ncbi:ribosome small subunit-dependent GTPase A [Phenylobacterium sp.]|uniref:ribosome small subunit-dependent GTPase A n=1 Tax=Phenylobacterium sp. TaxID=1871053 RepID=UPI0017F4DA90|nr:ribosome small subunit-dependent GTPase A [Phenylobacterium sp.]MBA4792476.1 ribosome small subunit-dependent GTPase A [Phenylobacterium sp.]MBC7168049.1 ribosome small subunit-dependent GTPase A [Phenylobacterium sp.]
MLSSYGWTDELQHDFAPYADQGLIPARVAVQHRARYVLIGAAGEFSAEASGRFLHNASATDLPVVGDWVAVTPPQGDGVAIVQAVLPRRSQFVRRAAGTQDKPQVVAANFDVVFLTTGLDADFNLRRIERYLTAAWRTGAQPVVVLTKADLVDDPSEQVAEVEKIAAGAPVHALSSLTGEGVEAVAGYLAPGRTAVLLGMSGVGKSTLVNALAGEARQTVGEVRAADGRGRHTTTHRELILLPGGGLILDTPGMRELGLWDPGEEAASQTFEDIEALALQCRFRNCAHAGEPGCAVQAAIAAGDLTPERLESYRKLERESAYFERKDDPMAAIAHRKLWASRAKANRRRKRAEDED